MKIRTGSVSAISKKPEMVNLTSAGQLARDLDQGLVDRVELGDESVSIERRIVLSDFASKAFLYGSFGAVGTFLTMNQAPLGMVGMGVATAVGLGAYLAWNQSVRENSGTVEIVRDGEARKTRYYRSPESYIKTLEEQRSQLHIDGTLGESFQAFSRPLEDLESISISPRLEEQKSELQQLAKERKLVADLGEKSRYGYPALSLVDARVAAKLVTANRDVFVAVGETTDKKHSLQVAAYNRESTARAGEVETYVDRTFDYQLTKLEGLSDLQKLPRGKGLPDGILGVYRDQKSCSVTIGVDNQYGFGQLGKTRVVSESSNYRVLGAADLDLGPEDAAKIVTKSSVNVKGPFTLVGVLAGMVTGMNLAPGIPGGALIGGIIGGIAGRELGLVAQSRVSN